MPRLSKDQIKAIMAKVNNGTWKAYDVKAKAKVMIQNPVIVTLKNGRNAIKGTSSKTGIKVFRII